MIPYPKDPTETLSIVQRAGVRMEYFPQDGTYRFNSIDLYELMVLIRVCLDQVPPEE